MKACLFATIALPILLLPSVRAQQPAIPPPSATSYTIADEAAFFDALNLDAPGMDQVKAAAQSKDWTAAKEAWARHLSDRTTPKWLWSRRDKDAIEGVFRDRFGGWDNTLRDADTTIARRFDMQGAAKTLDKDPQWNQGDNEWTNEFNRLYFIDGEAHAWFFSGDAKYAEDCVYLLHHWIAENPIPPDEAKSPGATTRWRTLEAGIRSQQWPDILEAMMDAPPFDAQAKYELTKTMIEHARALYPHEADVHSGNWQVSECSGLAVLGIMLPECKESDAWRTRALDTLTRHIKKDVFPDGGDYELTPSYHSWTTSEYLLVAQLAKLNGYDASGIAGPHEKMYEWMVDLAQPDQQIPAIADTHGPLHIRGEMGDGALMYRRPDFRWFAGKEFDSRWIWLFGPSAASDFDGMAGTAPTVGSVLLADSCYAVMRTGWKPEDKYLFFTAAPWGGGHNHLDRMEVVAYAGGRELLIDPGMGGYSHPLAGSYFRHSMAHNVVVIDGRDQPNPPQAKLLDWHSDDQADFVEGEVKEAGGMAHQRAVFFMKPDYWVVFDRVRGQGTHDVSRFFHFAEGPVEASSGEAHTAFPDGTNMSVLDAAGAPAQLIDGWVAHGEGAEAKAQVAEFAAKAMPLPATFTTVLFPFTKSAGAPKVTVLSPAGGDSHIQVTFPDGRTDEIVASFDAASLKVPGQTATAHAICLSQPEGAMSQTIVVP